MNRVVIISRRSHVALIAFGALLSITSTQAETVTEKWVKHFNPSSGTDLPSGVTMDGTGNVFVIGYQNPGGVRKGYIAKYAAGDGSLLWSLSPDVPGYIPEVTDNGDLLVGSSAHDGVYLARRSGIDGHLLWEKTGPGGLPKAMKLDSAGNIIFTAWLQNDVRFDDNGHPYSIGDYYTAKYSAADGHLIWEKQYNGPANNDDLPADLAVDSSGNVVVTGESKDSAGRPEIYTAKYAANDGHLLWERRYNGPNANRYDRGHAVTVDPFGDVLVTGQGHDFDLYVAKYSGLDGHVIWENVIPNPGGAGLRRGNDVVADARGNALVAGYASVNNSTFFLAKYRSSDGALIWEKLYLPAFGKGNGAELRRIALDAAGNIVTAGPLVVGPADQNDAYIGKFSSGDGGLIWEKTYDSAAHFDDSTADSKPFEIGADGTIALGVQSSLGGQDWEFVTIKYAVGGAGAGGSRRLWAAGRDLLSNEIPDDAAETAAINADAPQWSYGYRSAAASTALTLFTPQQHVNDPSGLEGWIAPGQATLGVNTRNTPIVFNSGSGDYKPLLAEQLYLSPGSNNEFLVARWTAPEAGDYRILARWVDLDNHGGNGAIAQLIKNGSETFNCTDGKPCSFAQIIESTATKTARAWMRARTLSFNAGDTLDFVVGSLGEHTFDATAFNALVRRVPKVTITSPASGVQLTGGAQNVTVNVNVEDVLPASKVTLKVDDAQNVVSDASAPYSLTALLKPGYHRITAIATDSGGAVVESPEIAVIVAPASAPQAASSLTRKGDSSQAPAATTLGRLFFSQGSGSWNDPATWGNQGGVPLRWDYAVIQVGHHVTLDLGISVRDVTINGKLSSVPGASVQYALDVYGTLHATGQIENLDLYINGPTGKFLILGTSPVLRFVNIYNQSKFTITASEFKGEGVTIENRGNMYAWPPIASQGPLVVPFTGFNQRGGQTTLGINTVLRAPSGVNLNGILQLSPNYAPAISENGAGVVSNHGGSLISDNGAAIIGLDGGTLIGDYGSGIISDHSSGLIGNAGGTYTGPDGFHLIGNAGGTFISEQGGASQATQVTPVSTAQTSPTPGTITLTGGTIAGTGEIRGNVINQGAFITPGNSAGGIVVNGNYTQQADATLLLELGGKTLFDSFSYDVFQVAGTATLGGNLVVKTINGYTPASGDTIPAVLYGSHTGNFASISSNAQVSLGADGLQVTTNGANPQGPRALNISTRLQIQSGDNALFAGFIVTGPAGSTKKVLIRGIGPSLAQFGVAGTIPDPFLELHTSSSTITNDNWQQASNANEIPNGFAPADPKESIIIATLGPGNYSAILKGAHGGTGVGLAEVYDLEPASTAQLANIATRGLVQTGDTVLIGGFIVAGTQPAKVLVRAIGPSLSAFGVQGALQDTTLEVHDSNGGVISNDNWRETDEAAITGTGIPPSHDNEAAVLAILAPGNYTAVVRGADDTTGIAVVEAYNLQ